MYRKPSTDSFIPPIRAPSISQILKQTNKQTFTRSDQFILAPKNLTAVAQHVARQSAYKLLFPVGSVAREEEEEEEDTTNRAQSNNRSQRKE